MKSLNSTCYTGASWSVCVFNPGTDSPPCFVSRRGLVYDSPTCKSTERSSEEPQSPIVSPTAPMTTYPHGLLTHGVISSAYFRRFLF